MNAANPSLLGGGGVDGAIHSAAGNQLYAACKALEVEPGTLSTRCPTGQARVTSAGSLPCRRVIHTVGPVYSAASAAADRAALGRAYRSSLMLAVVYDVKTVAFPSISSGIYGYPVGDGAKARWGEERTRAAGY